MKRPIELLAVILVACLCSSVMAVEGLEGKVMCGYQGWFRVPADDAGGHWRHYTAGPTFEPGKCSIDLWPDVRELPAADRIDTPFRHADGSVAQVYSAPRAATVDLHFRWMQQYGIDGVFVQRFPTDTRDHRHRQTMDTLLAHCQQAAHKYGRRWVLMYDLSGMQPGTFDQVKDDWRHLQQTLKVADQQADPAYLAHRDKPLVALWGLGFNDRPAQLDAWRSLIEFFNREAIEGGCSVMVGVPTYWRTLDRDTIADARLHEVMALADVVSPWTVGRYRTPEQARQHSQRIVPEDLAWCEERKLDYLPVAFPGFSWHNLMQQRGNQSPVQEIPRLGGEFFWAQVASNYQQGVRMQYVAMFDELDEGTAIFKCRSDSPVGDSPFASEPDVPGDHYLWLTGQTGRLLRGELPGPPDEMPRRPTP